MARKIIDTGVVGNDGTGDSIRDSFRKVNDNFRELYSSLGLEGRQTFIGLDDTPSPLDPQQPYRGLNNPATGATPLVTVNNTETGLAFKTIQPGDGIAIDYLTNPDSITIASEFQSISADAEPQLGGPLNSASGGIRYPFGNLVDVRAANEVQDSIAQLTSTYGNSPEAANPDRLAVNKGYADSKISLAGIDAVDPVTNQTNPTFGQMTGPLILSRDPEDSDDDRFGGLIAATKRYVDNAGFGSTINLYVATSGRDERAGVSPQLQGRALAYAYRSISAAMQRADEILREAPIEIGPYKKQLTFDGGNSVCTLSSIAASPDSGTGFSAEVDMSADSITLEFAGTNYSVGDLLEVEGGTGEAITILVTSTLANPGPIQSFSIISRGVYSTLPAAVAGELGVSTEIIEAGAEDPVLQFLGEGALFSFTYRVNRVRILEKGEDYGLVSVRILGGGGTGAFGTANVVGGEIKSISIDNPGQNFTGVPTVVADLPRFFINTNGLRTDFTGDVVSNTPESARTQDLRPGLFLIGDQSGALAQILEHTGELSDNDELFDVDIKLGSFIEGESISYGDISRATQISIIVESGIYEEHYPIKVPQNVALLGDEFRRVLIRPKKSISASSWGLSRFRRDLTLGRDSRLDTQFNTANGEWETTPPPIEGDTLIIGNQLYGYHYLRDASKPIYPKINNPGGFNSAAELLSLNKRFIQLEVTSWIDQQIVDATQSGDVNSIWYQFDYNNSLCQRDVGLIVDAIVFDLKYGEYHRSAAAALRYFENDSSKKVITSVVNGGQLEQHIESLERINILSQLIIRNIEISQKFNNDSRQIIDTGIVAEMGVGTERWDLASFDNSVSPVTILIDETTTLVTGDRIIISGVEGVSQLNKNIYFIKSIASSTTNFELYLDDSLTQPVNSADIQGTYVQSTGVVSNSSGIIDNLIEAITTIIQADPDDTDYDGPVNFPKNNDSIDVFLCNDATILRRVTCQGHGGFMMVLDPVGQILAKSPYAQECASFSRSINRQFFAGGMYVDGFAGNLEFKHESTTLVNGEPTRISVSGLDRFPQLPASFIVDGDLFRINYVRNFVYSPDGSTGDLELSTNTPFTRTPGSVNCTISQGDPAVITAPDHRLQPGAIIQFDTDGVLPDGIEVGKSYYVLIEELTNDTFRVTDFLGSRFGIETTTAGSGNHSFQRIYEILAPGNRSMLANDFTQINDMGYGLVTNNGGLLEAVSVFTYYCFISYYSINGGQIRSISGSSAHGKFALVAEGADPLEVPTPTSIYHDFSQKVICYNDGVSFTNTQNGLVIFVTGYNHLPLNSSELEINHNGEIARYSINSVQEEELLPNVARLNLSAGAGGAVDGLAQAVPDGLAMTIRQLSEIILTDDLVQVATRPSTGLRLSEDPNRVYRVLQFSSYQDPNAPYPIDITPGDPGGFAITVTVNSIESNVCQTETLHQLRSGDKFIPSVSSNGLTANTTYYIKDISAYNKFTLSVVQGGGVLSLTDGTGLSIRGKRSHRLRENSLLSFTTANPSDTLPEPLEFEVRYFVTTAGLTDTEFLISNVRNGFPIEITSSGSGEFFTNPEGLTRTVLRENYDYISLTTYQPGEFASDYTPINVTINIGGTNGVTSFTSATSHNLAVGDVVKFVTTGNLPTGLLTARHYYVIETATSTTFRVSAAPNGSSIITTGTQSGTHSVGLVTGKEGDQTFAIVPLSPIDSERAQGAVFNYLGDDYTVVSYENESDTGNVYGRITLDKPLINSIIQFGTYTISASPRAGTVASTGNLTIRISLVRVTGHDLLDIGTGSYADTNYPNDIYGPPVNPPNPAAETDERDVGRVFYVSTDQFGNFRVGPYFLVDQGTGTVSFSASIALSNLDGLGFKRGVPISEFSVDSSFAGNAVDTVPTENATRNYIERRLGVTHGGGVVPNNQVIPASSGGFMALSGITAMKAAMNLGNNRIVNLDFPVGSNDAVNQLFVERLLGLTKTLDIIDGAELVAGPDGGFMPLNGSLAMKDNMDLDDHRIVNVADPVDDQDAPNKKYIERVVGLDSLGAAVPEGELIPGVNGGFMPLNGSLAMKDNMDLDDHRIVNVADPVDDQDAVNLQSLTFDNLQDFSISTQSLNQIFVFDSAGDVVNASMTGDINLSLNSANRTVSAQIVAGSIVNSDVSASAAIAQSKLSLTAASTRTAATGITQENLGLASFDSSQFNATNGWISVKNNGISFSKLSQVTATSVLGNSTTANANATSVSFGTVVNIGGAIKKSQYSSSGFLRRTGGTNTADTDYVVVEASASYTAPSDNGKLIQRDSNGDFAARNADLSRLIIDGNTALDSTGTSGNLGNLRLYGFDGAGGIFLQNGPNAVDKTSFYDNNAHKFRTQDGSSVAPIEAASLKASTVEAQTLTTGSATTAGTIIGNWSLGTNSKLQATYSADLAEYYEGDKVYEVGSVLVFGGKHEVTIANQFMDTRVAGIVSDNAAFIMYDACPGYKNLIALQGRVPCKVVGKIQKGDILVTAGIPGVAIAAKDVKAGTMIGKALEEYNSDHIGTIEIAVGRT